MKKILMVLIIFVGILGLFSGLYLHSLFDYFKEKNIDESIVKNKMQVNFFGQAVKMQGTERLQFASLKQIEVIEKKSLAKIKWIDLNLPSVVVGAVIPVEYTYFIELNEKWVMDFKDESLIVKVPQIKFNSPAVDVSKMQLLVTHSSMFRNETKVLESLKNSISTLLINRANDNIEIIKETGRRKIESFITKWIINYYNVKRPKKVIVIFKEDKKMEL